MNEQLAVQRLRAIVHDFVPRSARRYTWRLVNGIELTSSTRQHVTDQMAFEGRVVDLTSAALIVQTERTRFFLVDPDILGAVPFLGDTVRIEPYGRRDFSGQRLDAPKVERVTLSSGEVIQSTIVRIGEWRTSLPIPKPKCQYLVDLVDQLETLRAPDNFRTVAQLLVDANATGFTLADPGEDAENLFEPPPALAFNVSTRKFAGRVSIEYWAVPDLFAVNLHPESGTSFTVKDVDFTSVGEVLYCHIDDGQWRIAKVTKLKGAKLRAAKKGGGDEHAEH